jgi:hypothetical protein
LVFFGFLAMIDSSRVKQLIERPRPVFENRRDHVFLYTKRPALARNFEKNSLFFMCLMIVHVNARSSMRAPCASRVPAPIADISACAPV